jgi:hypothetical protein
MLSLICSYVAVCRYVLCSTFCAVRSVQYVLCSTFCAVRSVQYVLCSTFCAVRSVQYVLSLLLTSFCYFLITRLTFFKYPFYVCFLFCIFVFCFVCL